MTHDGAGRRRPGNRPGLPLLVGGAVVVLAVTAGVVYLVGSDDGSGGSQPGATPSGTSATTAGRPRATVGPGAVNAAEPGATSARTQTVRPTVPVSPVPTGSRSGGWPPVTDAPLTFSVSKVEYGLSKFGNGEGARPLPGRRYTVVHLSVRNGSGKPVLLPHNSQGLADTLGRGHRAEVAAEAGVPGNRLLIPVPAGATVQGVLVFSLVARAKPTQLRLRGVSSSAGAVLRLS